VDLTANRRQPWNPAMWAADLFAAWNQKQWSASVRPGLKLAGLFAFGIGGLLLTAKTLYRGSWDRALQALSGETDLLQRRTRLSWLSHRLSSRAFSQEVREVLLFLRDPSQWSQVFVLCALMALYLFSVSKVTDNLLGATSFIMALLNTLFVSFISLSIASRFVFTSFSADGEAIWLMKTAPEGWAGFVRAKLIVFGVPCLFFSIALGVLSGVILGLSNHQLWVLGMHGLWDGSLMIALSLGMGMLFINPGIENPLKLIISPGGLLLMVVGVFFAAVHLVLRLTTTMPTLNSFLSEYGWPDMSEGRGRIIIGAVIAVEALGAVILILRGMRHLRRGLFVS
jgi:ABC-2 type transport system permease protein